MISKEFHEGRRELFARAMKKNTVELLSAGEEKQEKGDENYPFVPDADFYYLTGFEEPEACLAAVKKGKKTEFSLFIHHTTEREARWLGHSYTKKSVSGKTGIEHVMYLEELPSFLKKTIKKNPKLKLQKKHTDLSMIREIKTDEEIALHKKAAEITGEGVGNILQNLKPDMHEYEIEAYFDFILKKNNAGHSFRTIAASGKNACIMHYMKNDRKMKKGDMILFDLGAEWKHYACDVSRTYPVNGEFTDQQKMLYTVVLDGLKAAEAAAKPGYPKDQLQELSKKVMADELVKCGFIKKPEEIDKYYVHGSGHYIGLFTHDVGDNHAKLEKNMMFTLEPGLYFDELKLGIRIEDTLLVTEDGVNILTDAIPKEIEDIENIM